MRCLDLTHVLRDGALPYPGDPETRILPAAADGVRVTALSFGSHTGTHVDAPAHALPDGAFLDALPPSRFWGRAVAVDCRGFPGEIPLGCLAPVRAAADRADFLLLRTDWCRRWGAPDYFRGYPVPGPDLIQYCIDSGKKGLGTDTPGPDAAGALEHHRALLAAGVLPVENLRDLSRLPAGAFWFSALPLRYESADGAPVCAAAWLEECP